MKKIPVKRIFKLIKDNLSFFAIIAATFVALALVVSLTFGSFYQNARTDAVAIGNLTVSLEAQRIEDALYSGINALLVSGYTVENMMKNGADADEINEYLMKETEGIKTGINPEFTGIYGVVNDVYVDGTGTDWLPEGYDPYSRPWYHAAAESRGELAIVSPYIDAQTGKTMVSFSKLLYDGKSAVSLDIGLNNIYEATEEIQLNGNGYCFLADVKGQIIAHRDESQVGKNYLSDPEFEGSDMQSLIIRINNDTQAKELQHVRLNGKNCMVFTHSVQGQWNVVLVVENNDLFRDIHAGLIRNILISLAIFILVGYFCTSNYRNRKKAIRYAEDIRTDDLTGLNNRGEFDRYLRTTLDGVSMEKSLYLMLFDADNFKGINDRFGHQEGDRALRYIAKALKEICRGTDFFCARYGGDEFVIICKCEDENEVKRIVSDMDNMLNGAMAENSLPYTLSISCGYACYDPSKQSLSDLVDTADHRLYRVKAEKKQSRDKKR